MKIVKQTATKSGNIANFAIRNDKPVTIYCKFGEVTGIDLGWCGTSQGKIYANAPLFTDVVAFAKRKLQFEAKICLERMSEAEDRDCAVHEESLFLASILGAEVFAPKLADELKGKVYSEVRKKPQTTNV